MTVRYKSATLDEFIEHHSHDVSRGGMFIKTPQAFPPGTLLKFEVRIAEDRKVMQGVGRVVWKRDITAADTERPAGMGVKFIKLDDDSRRLIDQLLSSRRDESSAFDEAEAAQGVEAEAPIGLGTEPLSVAPGEPSFFPKLAPAELPAPEDRTVMKQAAELLQEALREVGDSGSKHTAKAPPSPTADDDKEDTKPGRPSKPSDSGLKVPAPRVPPPNPRATSHGTPSAAPLGSKAAPSRNSTPSPGHPDAAEMASVAQEITDKARLVSASKPAAIPSRKPAARTGKEPLAARSLPATKPVPLKPIGAQPVLSSASRASRSGRAVFWFLAVAACAAGTWFLWRPTLNPASEPPKEEQLQAQPPTPPPAEPTPPPSAAAPEPASPEAAAASVEAPVPSAPEPAAVAAPSAPVVQPEAAPAAVKPAVVPKVARRKPTATEVSGSEPPPAETPPPPPEATPEPKPEAPPPAETKPAEPKPVEPKPAAPAEPVAPKAAPADPPPAAPPAEPPAKPPATKKRSAPAAETDNPY
jgi:uncharacterized protein (TIGR02266 family)